MPRPRHLVELEVLSVMEMVLLKSPQASIHWTVRPACCGNPGWATVTGKAYLAKEFPLTQGLEEPVARQYCDLSCPQRRLLCRSVFSLLLPRPLVSKSRVWFLCYRIGSCSDVRVQWSFNWATFAARCRYARWVPMSVEGGRHEGGMQAALNKAWVERRTMAARLIPLLQRNAEGGSDSQVRRSSPPVEYAPGSAR